MNTKDPAKVASIIENLKESDRIRSENRALINGLFNGDSPWTSTEAEENRIQVNVNWGEAPDLLLKGREQYNNAFLTTANFFTVRLPDAPESKKNLYEGTITKEANKVFKRSREFMHTCRERFASVALHGKGAAMWADKWAVIPKFIGVDDLKIPTDTLVTLENLSYFAVHSKMTPWQLAKKTIAKGKNIDPGWNLKAVQSILKDLKEQDQNVDNTINWFENPEKVAELFKENQTYYDSDAAPCAWFWYFFHQEDDGNWFLKVILDYDSANTRQEPDKVEFVYESKKAVSRDLNELLHVQFGDGNNVPPFKYHSVRGLGHRLYDAAFMMNRLRCQFTQKVFEEFLTLFHVQDPNDRAKAEQIFLGPTYGLIPDGMSFVKREERYQADPQLVEMLMANMKQLMGEGSASFTQDIDTGTRKEQTAFEVSAKLNQATKLSSDMLNLAYYQEVFFHRENCRRLCLKGSPDFLAKKFQAECKAAGVPEKWLDVERWEIEPERVLGGGNQQIGMAEAQALMSVRQMLPPPGQAIALNKFVFQTTRDARLTEEIAPRDAAPHVTDTMHDTELVFGALMTGAMVTPKPGLNPVEVVETMLRLMSQTVQQINQSGGLGTPQQVKGLDMSAQYTGNFIQQLAQDPSQKQRVKQYSDVLGKLMNMVKAFAQRQQEAAKKAQAGNGGMDPETMAKIKGDMAATKVKLAGKQAADQQKLQHKELSFQADQKRKTAEALAKVHNDSLMATAEAGSRPYKRGGLDDE